MIPLRSRLLDRYILLELAAAAAFLQAAVLAVGVPLYAARQLPREYAGLVDDPLAAAALLLPAVLAYSLPVVTLLAAAVVLGRQSRDQELLAMEAAGVGRLRRAVPYAVLGLGAGAVTFHLLADAVPRSRDEARRRAAESLARLLDRPPDEPVSLTLAAGSGSLAALAAPAPAHELHLWRADESGRPRDVLVLSDPSLQDGILRGRGVYARWSPAAAAEPLRLDHVLMFAGLQWPLDVRDLAPDAKRPRDMTWNELADAATAPEAPLGRNRYRRGLHAAAAAGFSPLLLACAAWLLVDRFRPRWAWQAVALALAYWVAVHYPLQLLGDARALNDAAGGAGPWLPWLGAVLLFGTIEAALRLRAGVPGPRSPVP